MKKSVHGGSLTAPLMGVAFATVASGFPIETFALRPFESTDADVVDAGEIELELGYLTIERDAGETAYTTPSFVFNYGLLNTLEFVAEFDVQKRSQESWEIVDPGLFLKWLVAEGALQNKPGVSMALEAGALLPPSKDDEHSLGGEVVFIASGELDPLTYHVNLGGGVDSAGDEFWTWGAIGEASVLRTLTLAVEVDGEEANGDAPERSALIGARFQPEGSAIILDMGLRRGFTSPAADWSLTLGLTTNF